MFSQVSLCPQSASWILVHCSPTEMLSSQLVSRRCPRHKTFYLEILFRTNTSGQTFDVFVQNLNPSDLLCTYLPIAREGNVIRSICLFTGGGVWCHFLSGSMFLCSFKGVCLKKGVGGTLSFILKSSGCHCSILLECILVIE